jgi:hypothetical protein
MVPSGAPRKKSQVTPPGFDPGTLRLVAQRLNHYATPGPSIKEQAIEYCGWAVVSSDAVGFSRIY